VFDVPLVFSGTLVVTVSFCILLFSTAGVTCVRVTTALLTFGMFVVVVCAIPFAVIKKNKPMTAVIIAIFFMIKSFIL
jgi:hypothetical protein